jgi:hypothetical protein
MVHYVWGGLDYYRGFFMLYCLRDFPDTRMVSRETMENNFRFEIIAENVTDH